MLEIFFVPILIVVLFIAYAFLSARQRKEIRNKLNSFIDVSRQSKVDRDIQRPDVNMQYQRNGRDVHIEDELKALKSEQNRHVEGLDVLEKRLTSLERQIQMQNTVIEELKLHSMGLARTSTVIASHNNTKEQISQYKQSKHYPICFYVTSPIKNDPVRFSEEYMSKTEDLHYFKIKIQDAEHAEIYLADNIEALNRMLSNLAYTKNCIDVLEKSRGVPKKIEIISPGELKYSDGYWTLTRKLQIKIL